MICCHPAGKCHSRRVAAVHTEVDHTNSATIPEFSKGALQNRLPRGNHRKRVRQEDGVCASRRQGSASILCFHYTDIRQLPSPYSLVAPCNHGRCAIHGKDFSLETDASLYSFKISSCSAPDFNNRLARRKTQIFNNGITIEEERPACCVVDSGMPGVVA